MQLTILTVFVAIFSSCIKTGSGAIVIGPSSSEAPVGVLAFFNCSTNIASMEIQWFHYPVSNSERKIVYGFDQFHDVYRGFHMDRDDSTGSWNLVIPSVAIENAGKYECQDDLGRGEKRSANLIVLGSAEFKSEIETKNVIGSNNCGIEPSQLILSCSVRYHGSEAPTLQWLNVGENRSIIDGVTKEIFPNDRVVYNLTLTGDRVVNGSSYACHATKSKSSKANCESGNITVVSSVSNTSISTPEPCENNIGVIIVIVIFVSALLNAIEAFTLWYLFIYRQKMKIYYQTEAKNSKACGAQTDQPGKYPGEEKDENNTEEEKASVKEKDTEEQNSSSTSKQQTNAEEGEPMFGQKQENAEGRTFSCTLWTAAIIFVCLMAIPFCIGLILLALLVIYRRIQLKNEEVAEQLDIEDSDTLPKSQTVGFGFSEADAESRGQKEQMHSSFREEHLDKDFEEMKKQILELQEENRQLKENSETQDIVKEQQEKVKELELNLYSSETVKYMKTMASVHTIKPETATNERKFINGLAVLDNELYILHEKSSEIEVYDSVTYQFTRKLAISIIDEPFDLTAGNADKCLFVIFAKKEQERDATKEWPNTVDLSPEATEHMKTEMPAIVHLKKEGVKEKNTTKGNKSSGSFKIWKKKQNVPVKKDDSESLIGKINAKGEMLDRWPISSGGYYGQLSTHESNLIVCVLEKNIITEFDRDGQFIRTVRLSPAAGLVHPIHAIKVTSMHYVVTHGNEKDELYRICVVDLNGYVVKEFRDWKKGVPVAKLPLPTHAKFRGPIHFVEDSERSLIVTDTSNHRIILLNSTLKYQKKLIDLDSDQVPMRICLDDTQKRLFVAVKKESDSKGYKDGLVAVYNIKQ